MTHDEIYGSPLKDADPFNSEAMGTKTDENGVVWISVPKGGGAIVTGPSERADSTASSKVFVNVPDEAITMEYDDPIGLLHVMKFLIENTTVAAQLRRQIWISLRARYGLQEHGNISNMVGEG